MSVSFPTNPSVGQIYQNWVWSGSTWDAVSPGMSLQKSRQVFIGGSGTYTTPVGVFCIEVEMVGGGSSGYGGQGANPGTATTFGTSFLVCNPGIAGVATGTMVSNGGTASGGDINITGGTGGTVGPAGVPGQINANGNNGASSPFGGAGAGFPYGQSAGSAQVNSGSGGGSGGVAAGSGVYAGQGGGAGGYLRKMIMSPSATYPYVVGTGGAGTIAVGATNASGNGGSGIIIVTEYRWISTAVAVAQAAPGARVLLKSQVVTATVASVQFFYNFTNQYDEYIIDVYDLALSSTSDFLYIQLSTDGSTFDATSGRYGNVWTYNTYPGGTVGGGGNSSTGMYVTAGTTNTSVQYTAETSIKTTLLWAGDRFKYFRYGSSSQTSNAAYYQDGTGFYIVNTAVKGIQFLSGGTTQITKGVFNLYGIVKASAGATP